ncbi:FtsX-like permease family protein [Pseudonocardia sp. TRM90224]|uniref:FtsX-like permease family protein n=1 Tax=Pseudonocardia sp. TRM90224 TaxID=2812678 RepID=UPI001E347A32|nr:FtsX-like permease family protein [Pseudonocardia sp. TRM90224]
MIKIVLAGLRFRAAGFAATFVAVLLGCALLVACGGLFETALRLDAPPQRYAGAPVVVTGPIGFALPDEESETVPYAERPRVAADRLAEIAASPGVARAVPDVSFPAALAGDPLTAHGWASAALAPFDLHAGTEPRRSGDVVLDAGSAARLGAVPGAGVEITVAGAPRTFTLVGIAAGPVSEPVLLAFDADAARWAPTPGAVDAIGVFPEPGVAVADVAAALPADLAVRTGAERGRAEFAGIDAAFLPLILLSAIFGGMVVVVMALVVSATVGLSVRQRHRELALLRAAGATPRQVSRMVVAETMTVSVLAALAGVPLGALLGSWIFSVTAARGVVPAVLQFHQGLVPFAAGALLALVVPWVAAAIAARAAGATRPIAALGEAAIPAVSTGPLRGQLALAFAAATVVLAGTTMFLDPATASAVGGPALLTGAIAVGLRGPELIVMAAALLGRIAGLSNHLAIVNTRSRAMMFASVLTPVTLAVAIALGNSYAQTTRNDAVASAYVAQFTADLVVAAPAGSTAEQLAQVREIPGVAGATPLITSKGWIEQPYDGRGSDPAPLVGIDAANADQESGTFAVPVVTGSIADLTGNTVALPQARAEALGITVGERVGLLLGDGARAEVTVVALLDAPVSQESVVVPAALLAPHTTTGAASQFLVRAAPDTDATALGDEIGRRLPGATVGDTGLLAAGVQSALDVEAWINYLLAFLAFAYAAIASVNTLAVAVLSRRRELAVQRLAGATRRQVMGMLVIESGIIAIAAVALGTVIALCSVVPTAVAVGAGIPSGPVWIFLAVAVAALAIVWPATLLTARLAMRHRPIDTIALPG